jgi:photosystem II stability/assembly factor-like uncharacterized protein
MYHCKILFFFLCFSSLIFGQTHFTPYDDLPGINKSLKPNLLDDAPKWARSMYAYPVNFNTLQAEYEQYQSKGKKKNPYTRYFKHWSRYISPLVDGDGVINMPDQTTVINVLKSERTQKLEKGTRNTNEWTFLGPKVTHWLKEDNSVTSPAQCPWQVNIYCLDIAKTNPDIMYCGTETGAINKTIDKGLTWQLITLDYFTGGGVNDIVVHSQDPNIVYASAGRQVHRTKDGGTSWMPLLKDIFFDANTLQISNDGKKILASSDDGIYISTNEGLTWEKKLSVKAYDIEFNAKDENVIFVLAAVNQNFVLYQSTNGGQNFNAVSNFPGGYKDAAGGVLAVTAANGNLLMMTLLTDNNTPVVLKGNQNNNLWAWSEIAKGKTSKLRMDNGQGYYDLDMEISPIDEQKFVVATTTLYKTANGGNTFTPVGGYEGQFPIHPDIQDMTFDNVGNLWVATDGGLSMSTDYFTSLSNFNVRTNGIIGSDFWGFDQGWNEDIIVGGRYHNGNTAIADFYQPKALRMGGAESPTGWVIQGKSRHVAFDDLGGGWILPPKAEDKYEGRFLFSKFPNMDEYGGRRGALLHHPYYHSHLYLGQGNGFWASKDAGKTWEMQHQFTGKVMTMQIGINHPDIIYADIAGQGLHRSDDGGFTWVKKGSLTTSPHGSSYWNGKLSLAISPYDPNIIYACLQNGTWSADKGRIFKSKDGGTTWQNITFGLDVYLKSLVVQPSAGNKDLLYLFTNAKNNLQAEVWVLEEGSSSWKNFSNGYPIGMSVNHVLPFYRDGKVRVAGNLGVWEAPLYDTQYEPIIRPWIEREVVQCVSDTITLEDHSIIAHQNIKWEWKIDPQPRFISATNIRNPKLVLGKEGKYDISLKVNVDGKSYEKLLKNSIEAKRCPSVETCDNPARLAKTDWKVIGFDSEEVNDPGRATMAIDNNLGTIWHTRWSTGNDPYPHFIYLDLGRKYKLFEFVYLPRQDGGENGRVKDYELYISDKLNDWGTTIAKGSFENSASPKVVKIPEGKTGRYIHFRALSEVNGNPWASAAELDFIGCYTDITATENEFNFNVKINPVPATENIHITLPDGTYKYYIFNSSGHLQSQGDILNQGNNMSLDVVHLNSGSYYLLTTNEQGIQYRMKFIKI